MRNALLRGLLVFSLLINITVAGTVGRHLWLARSGEPFQFVPSGSMTKEELKQAKQLWKAFKRAEMMETRRKIIAKRAEILDMIANNPTDIKAVDVYVDELTALKVQMEHEAVSAISKTMASLPKEKRPQFAAFLKSRMCTLPRRHCAAGPRGQQIPEHQSSGPADRP